MEEGITTESYEEATLFPDMDGKMKDIEDGIESDSIKEIMEELTDSPLDDLKKIVDDFKPMGPTKKASGGIARLLGE